MRVDIEKRHIDSYKKIAKEANKAIKSHATKTNKNRYKLALLQTNISVENKKKKLAKSLHELIISAFSINIKKVKNNKKLLENTKADIELIRYIIHKIKSINNYLEESLLQELGVIKKSLIVRAVKSDAPLKYIEKNSKVLTKGDIDRIEYTIYELMQNIIFFDKSLLKGYKKKEIKVVKSEKLNIKDIEKILKAESEILETLEAKMPPPSKVKAKLFTKAIFNRWIPMVFALLSAFETEYGKEKVIFLNIKKNDRLRNKIESNIKHVIAEKEKVLKIKEKRVMAMKNFKVSDDYRQTFHEYVSAASL